MKRQWPLRVLLLLVCLNIVTFFLLVWLAAERLSAPPRRSLRDYHREILQHANEHGLRIESFAVDDGGRDETPCLLCEPSKTPSAALKGNKLRNELTSLGIAVKPWGEINATLVLLHGHSGRKEDMLPVAERFCAAGFRCLLLDLPGHGDNPAPYATFGFNETVLPAKVLHTAAQRFHFEPRPAALFGVSQGGAIALQAAAQGEDIWFAIAELSTFASLKEVVDEQARRRFGILHAPARFLINRLVSWRTGYNLDTIRPIAAAAKLNHQYVLIGHGSADPFIAPKNARRLWDAVPSPHKEFLNIPGATHSSIFVTPAPVYATLCRFFSNAVPAYKNPN